MNFDKLLKILASMALAALVTVAAVSRAGSEAKPEPKATPAPAAAAPAKAPEKAKAPRTVELKVTENGFEPAQVSVKKGEPIRLRITRTTEETCAKDLIVPEFNIEKELPMNKAVDVEFTPSKSGKVKYGCSMGMMIAGVLIVE